jgi:hypothetical protein
MNLVSQMRHPGVPEVRVDSFRDKPTAETGRERAILGG